MINTTVHFLHKYFLWLLLLGYAMAVIAPGTGLFLHDLSISRITISQSNFLNITPSLMMLALLLLNAGLGIKVQEIKNLWSQPRLAIIGFFINSIVPVLLIFLFRTTLGHWHNQDELQNLLTGLALIVAMPIAGSSTAWSQNANGNLSLSLGLVLLSTIASPIITPAILHTFSFITTGDYSEDLQELAQQGSNIFMCFTVVMPSILGVILHFLFGETKIATIKPILKLINFIVLLLLNYSNAATSLPQAFAKPDMDFLGFILIVTTLMCIVAFGSGWIISKIFKTNKADMAALMFGLGMSNNGAGLVLASATLADHQTVLLPIIFYTLIQQIMAAVVDKIFFKNESQIQIDSSYKEGRLPI